MSVELQPSIGLEAAIKQRRAARSFKPDSIPTVVLEEILRLGMRAPSGYNLQPWRFVVLREQSSKDKLQSLAFNQTQIGEAPVVLICCGDRRAADPANLEAVIQLGRQHQSMNDRYAEFMRSQIPSFFENQPSFGSLEAWTNRHTMLAVAHMMIVAKSFGVDSCPMEGFEAAKVKSAFQIPDPVDICSLLCLGYANEPFKQYGGRFSPEQVCYSESYSQVFKF